MSGVTLEISINDAVTRELQALAAATGDLSPIMRLIGEEIVRVAHDAFEAEKSPSGAPWKQSIRAEKEDGQTLAKTGDLENSIDDLPTPRSVEVGSNKVYAAIHQLGGAAGPKARRVTLPARPYMPTLEELDQDYIRTLFQSHLQKGQKGAR